MRRRYVWQCGTHILYANDALMMIIITFVSACAHRACKFARDRVANGETVANLTIR